jgi:hypothetical protein
LNSLRATALRNKPWLRSTGPKTAAGKARSRQNATKHGERSVKSRAIWRELNAALRALNQVEHDSAYKLDGLTPTGSEAPGEGWVSRIADELRLSDLSRELSVARFGGEGRTANGAMASMIPTEDR